MTSLTNSYQLVMPRSPVSYDVCLNVWILSADMCNIVQSWCWFVPGGLCAAWFQGLSDVPLWIEEIEWPNYPWRFEVKSSSEVLLSFTQRWIYYYYYRLNTSRIRCSTIKYSSYFSAWHPKCKLKKASGAEDHQWGWEWRVVRPVRNGANAVQRPFRVVHCGVMPPLGYIREPKSPHQHMRSADCDRIGALTSCSVNCLPAADCQR